MPRCQVDSPRARRCGVRTAPDRSGRHRRTRRSR